MNTACRYLIKFQQGDLDYLRARLLDDRSREHFAILLGKTRKIGGSTIVTIRDMLFLNEADYQHQGMAFVQIKKECIYQALVELTSRLDVDTIVDVHTHPFAQNYVSFSPTDDRDERTFFRFLNDTFGTIQYASIVLSQRSYSARIWTVSKRTLGVRRALIKTQTSPENIASADFQQARAQEHSRTGIAGEGFFNRSARVLGLEVMRTIMYAQAISIVGVGGLGSIIAEHLIHMGFQELHLIDPDVLEVSNLNRVVGASYEDAEQQRAKVQVIKKHLLRINPNATVGAHQHNIHDQEVERVLALSDWIIVATDTHASRLRAQKLSLEYFVPLLSVGVNITVNGNAIEDMSGEVICARVGDALCLQCLQRINPILVASESHPDQGIRQALVTRGYVKGKEVKEPAVKTLNAVVATMAVEVLINQYTEARRHVPILVYENNGSMSIYEDRQSVQQRNKHCFLCHL